MSKMLALTAGIPTGAATATAAQARSSIGASQSPSGVEDPSKFSFNFTAPNFVVTYTEGAAVMVAGNRYEKSGNESLVLPAFTTGRWYIYYNTSGVLSQTYKDFGESYAWDWHNTVPVAILMAGVGVILNFMHLPIKTDLERDNATWDAAILSGLNIYGFSIGSAT
jgi:hypothetical protein